MSLLAKALQQADERLRSDQKVDVHLTALAAEVQTAGGLRSALPAAKVALSERVEAIETARDVVERLLATARQLEAILPFTEEGFGERRAELNSLLPVDPLSGFAAWIGDWLTAAAERRTAAMERLVGAALPMPPGVTLAVERCARATRTLSDLSLNRAWEITEPVLAAGAHGVQLRDQDVPNQAVRIKLYLMMARLALHYGLAEKAAAALDAAEAAAADPLPACAAIRARLAREAGDHETATDKLEWALGVDPADLDVSAELIRRARVDGNAETGLQAARVGVDALASLADLDAELGTLVDTPAELWVAVAERGARDGAADTVVKALDQASALASPEDTELRAIIAERRAELEAGHRSDAERAAQWIEAGMTNVSAGQIERAATNFERALALAPGHHDASLRLADCLSVLSDAMPFAQVREDLDKALDLVCRVQAAGGVTNTNSWSFLTEADIRRQLARAADPSRVDHLWRALLAAARAVAYQPDDARGWAILSETADAAALFQVAEAAATHATALQSGEQPSRIRALVNAGRFAEALTLLDPRSTQAWDQVVRAYLLLRAGDAAQAVRLLRTTALNPAWQWARETLIWALIIHGQLGEAREEARSFADEIGGRLDELECLLSVSVLFLVLNQLDDAERTGKEIQRIEQGGIGEGRGDSVIGTVELLRGDGARGVATLARSIGSNRSIRTLEDWAQLSRPFIEALASDAGVSLFDLSPVEVAVDRRRRELDALARPVDELETAPRGVADAEVVRRAKTLVTALLQFQEGDLDRAGETLERLHGDDGEPELEELGRSIAAAVADRAHREATRRVLDAVAEGALPTATTLLRGLLDEVPFRVDELLRAETGSHGVPDSVVGVLQDLARSTEYGERAANVLRWLEVGTSQTSEESEPPPERPLALELPPSWFEGHADPVNDHPLFLRYLPELRLQTGGQVPGVQVYAAEALEPDGYRMHVSGTVVDEGRVHPGWRYCPAETVEFLPAALGAVAEEDPDTGLHRIPTSVVPDPSGVTDFMTMSPVEVVIRRLGSVAPAKLSLLTQDAESVVTTKPPPIPSA